MENDETKKEIPPVSEVTLYIRDMKLARLIRIHALTLHINDKVCNCFFLLDQWNLNQRIEL